MNKFQLNAASTQYMGRSWGIEAETFLGSSDACHVQLRGEGIAPRHARVRLEEGRLTLEDLDSETGTWLNGEQISQSPLGSGDEIRIGPHRFLVQAPGLRPQRVIQPEAARKSSKAWLVWTLLALAAGAAAAAWVYQLPPFGG